MRRGWFLLDALNRQGFVVTEANDPPTLALR